MFVVVPAMAICSKYLESFNKFPPRQLPGNFNIAGAMEKMRKAQTKF
jgi:arylsulfatase